VEKEQLRQLNDLRRGYQKLKNVEVSFAEAARGFQETQWSELREGSKQASNAQVSNMNWEWWCRRS